jgi:hypothetical protein
VLDVDPGFSMEGGLVADVQPPSGGGSAFTFFDRLVTEGAGLPGVTHACAMSDVPLDASGTWMTWVPEGKTDAARHQAVPLGVTEGCFDALQVPLLEGRAFGRIEPEPVAIVSRTVARALWPDRASPVDERVHIGLASGPLVRVVGVAGDIRTGSLESVGLGQVWLPASRGWPSPDRLILRTHGDPGQLAASLRALLGGIDRNLALANVRTMQDIVLRATASRRFVLLLLGCFAGIAVTLCVVGIYGVLSHTVGQRTREIGIRVALGARAPQVARAIASQVSIGVGAGIVAGLAGAWALSSSLAALLFEMSATDGRVYGLVAGFVLLLAVLASLPPVARAAGVDPVRALRQD